MHPSSRIARENLEVFCDTWSQCVNDLSRLAKETDAAVSGRLAAEKQAYMSLPRPGVSYGPNFLNSSQSSMSPSPPSDFSFDSNRGIHSTQTYSLSNLVNFLRQNCEQISAWKQEDTDPSASPISSTSGCSRKEKSRLDQVLNALNGDDCSRNLVT